MPIEKAIHKLTGMSAEWLGLDTGTVAPGRAADVVVVDPENYARGWARRSSTTTSGCTARCGWSSVPTASCGRSLSAAGWHSTTPVRARFGREKFGRLLRSRH